MSATSIDKPTPGAAFLARIVDAAHERIAKLGATRSLESLVEEARAHVRRPFTQALAQSPPSIIAEVKKASPSKGLLRPDFDAVELARSYQAGGAAALSVLTEPSFFLGHDEWIVAIRNKTTLPILRKDFVLDPIQVFEAAAIGADAVLLIARLLSDTQLSELSDAAKSAGLDVLFEAHNPEELARIRACSPALIGINARDLDTFAVDTSQFAQLVALAPSGALLVAESGIESHEQIAQGLALGYRGFLIGESLVKSADAKRKIIALRTGESG